MGASNFWFFLLKLFFVFLSGPNLSQQFLLVLRFAINRNNYLGQTTDCCTYLDFDFTLVGLPFIGIPIAMKPRTSHPLDPLSAAEISVAIATVRAAGATPEVVY